VRRDRAQGNIVVRRFRKGEDTPRLILVAHDSGSMGRVEDRRVDKILRRIEERARLKEVRR
jgi:hypothetical protein